MKKSCCCGVNHLPVTGCWLRLKLPAQPLKQRNRRGNKTFSWRSAQVKIRTQCVHRLAEERASIHSRASTMKERGLFGWTWQIWQHLPVGLHWWRRGGRFFIAIEEVWKVRKRGQCTKWFWHLVGQGGWLRLDIPHEADQNDPEDQHVQALPLLIHLVWMARSGWCNR